MKLIIYETTHFEILPAMLDLALAESASLAVFLDHVSFLNLHSDGDPAIRWPGIQFIFRKEGVPNRNFIRLLFDFAHQNDYTHLHLSTLSNNYLYFAWKIMRAPYLKVSLTVHEVNLYRSLSFKNLLGFTESIAKYYFHRRIKRHRGLVPGVQAELEKYFPKARNVFIPSRFYEKSIAKRGIGPVKIIVPGTIETKRRDYEFVFHFISEYLSKINFTIPAELIFLGKAGTEDGKSIHALIRNFTNNIFKISYYEDHVPSEEYAKQMRDAKIIWNPIRIHTTGSREQEEHYGITKSAGFTADLIQFPMPALVPQGFEIPFYFKHCMMPYENENDLLQKMTWLLENDLSDLIHQIENDISVLIPSRFKKEFDSLIIFD